MSNISKEEYLKKYLSGPTSEDYRSKKTKKGKKTKITSRLKIYDDDADIKSVHSKEESIEDAIEDDVPVVADFVDERPLHVQQLEQFRNSAQWKAVQNQEERNKSLKRGRHDSESDTSPPRQFSSCSKKRHDSDSDSSPARQRQFSSHSTASVIDEKNTSKPRLKEQSNSHKESADSDLDLSPLRQNDSDNDLSPPRRKQDSDSDLSPPRKQKSDNSSTAMHSGAKSGLSSAKEMHDESTRLKRKEENTFQKIDKETLGKEAKTVFRDKSGKKRDLDKEMKDKEAQNLANEVAHEKFIKTNKGLKQQEIQKQNVLEALHEASKPLSRLSNDADLDNILKQVEREGDPMLAFIKKKKDKDDLNIPKKPRYKGREPPPNRYNIWPGYRWDGIDRSNGFENKLLSQSATRKAQASAAYKWSIEEM